MNWKIRLATVDDARAIAAIYGPVVAASPTSFEIDPPDGATMASRIRDILVRYPWLVLDRPAGVAGYAYATQHRVRAAYQWSVETSVYVAPGFQGRGIGRALYTSLIRILAAQGFANAFAGITLPNASSVRLHESVGFRPIGTYRAIGYKLGAWHDVGWWQLPLHEDLPTPLPPLALDALRQRPDWDALLDAGLPYLRGDA